MDYSVILAQLIHSGPSLLISLGGIVAALALWSRHPRVSALTVAALLVRTLATLGSLATTWYGYSQMQQGVSAAEVVAYSSVLGFAASAAGAIALLLLIVAVFTDRPSSRG